MTSNEIKPMLGFALAAIMITSIFVTMAPAGSANDNTPPACITNLQNVTGATWINWTWTKPPDSDFNYTMVFLNGMWETNTSEPFFNATALDPETSYEIGTHTVDEEGNVNRTWVNQTARTKAVPDTTAPETEITTGPSGAIAYTDATFTWTGSDDVTPTANLRYSFMLEGYDTSWSTWTSSTSRWYSDLPSGAYTFMVKALDEAENEDPTPATRSFIVDTTPPASITNLQNVTGATWINWTWTNPTDADFNYTLVYLNGTWKTNTSQPFFNATELEPETPYEIGTHTVDIEGNVNETWVNQTARTKAVLDTTVPASITNLQNVTGATWINWSWTDPPDADFNYTMVFLNGTWETNTSDSFYNATDLDQDTSYEIGTHTVDSEGNVNETWVNQTTTTLPLPDTTAPETEITTGPSGAIAYDDVTFTWTGSDDVTPTANLRYSFMLEGYDTSWSSWTSSTSRWYSDLPNGAYTFMVKALDDAENEDLTPATRSFTVSVTIRGGVGGGGGGGPSLDSDGDGYFDAVERLMGTNPNDPNDYPNKQEAATPTTTTTPPQTTKTTQTPTLPSTLALTVPQPVATPTSAPASATPVPEKLGFSRELAFEELVASIIVLAAMWLLVIAYLVLKME